MASGAEEHTISRIVNATARETGMLASVIRSDRRHAHIVRWRNAAYYIAHDVVGLSLSTIGSAFNRDHTSVLHGVRTARDCIASDKEFSDAVQRIAKASAPMSSEDKLADALIAYAALSEPERLRFLAFIAAGSVK